MFRLTAHANHKSTTPQAHGNRNYRPCIQPRVFHIIHTCHIILCVSCQVETCLKANEKARVCVCEKTHVLHRTDVWHMPTVLLIVMWLLLVVQPLRICPCVGLDWVGMFLFTGLLVFTLLYHFDRFVSHLQNEHGLVRTLRFRMLSVSSFCRCLRAPKRKPSINYPLLKDFQNTKTNQNETRHSH